MTCGCFKLPFFTSKWKNPGGWGPLRFISFNIKSLLWVISVVLREWLNITGNMRLIYPAKSQYYHFHFHMVNFFLSSSLHAMIPSREWSSVHPKRLCRKKRYKLATIFLLAFPDNLFFHEKQESEAGKVCVHQKKPLSFFLDLQDWYAHLTGLAFLFFSANRIRRKKTSKGRRAVGSVIPCVCKSLIVRLKKKKN